MDVCIFGASITYGYYDREKGGWVSRLRYYLENKKNFDDAIFNLGISGDTTDDFLARFDVEAKDREPEFIIFAISTNDPQFLIKENRFRIPIEKYKKNIQELLEKSRNYAQKIIIIGITPVDGEKTNPLAWSKNKIVKNENIELYNSEAKKICENENIKFIDLYDEMMKMDYKKLLHDGLHPNAEGHEWIARKVIKEIFND